MELSTDLSFHNIDSNNSIAILGLAREDSANAFNAEMMQEIVSNLDIVQKAENVRALVVHGKGKHFSAGADLGWMKKSAELSYDDNISDANNLTAMFEKLHNLPIPTVAVVCGAAFGGAVGLAACCDIVLCEKNSKICLSEVKLGLLPAVILPYLAKRILPGQLKRLSLSARIFRGDEALLFGFADRCFNLESKNETLIDELNQLLNGGPVAQSILKGLQRDLQDNSFKQAPSTAEAIAKARTGEEGQTGLTCFFQKSPPPWSVKINGETKLI